MRVGSSLNKPGGYRDHIAALHDRLDFACAFQLGPTRNLRVRYDALNCQNRWWTIVPLLEWLQTLRNYADVIDKRHG